jgi:basic membrane protein A
MCLEGASSIQGEQLLKTYKLYMQTILGLFVCCFGLLACGDYGFTVHVIYSENGRGDVGMNDSSFISVVKARDAIDATVVQWTPKDFDEAGYLLTSVLAEPLRSPDELIILVGETYDSLVSQVECQFRARKVLHIEGLDADCSKVQTVDFKTYAASYMAGVAAANASQTGIVSVVGGALTRDISESVSGFIDGANSAGAIASSTYLSASQNGFNNYDEGYRMATEMFSQDSVDVIFVAAGATGLGVLEAAKQGTDRYVIGYEFDLSESGSNVVLGSVVKDLDSFILDGMQKTMDGDFDSGHLTTGLEEGSVSFSVNENLSGIIGTEHLNVRDTALAAEAQYREAL